MSESHEFMRLKRPQREELADLAALMDSGRLTRWGTAIDGGAHIGGWTQALAARFTRVIAFEPAADVRSTLEANTRDLSNVTVRPEALMDAAFPVRMAFPRKSRALTSRVAMLARPEDAETSSIALDALDLTQCDLIKLDLEGAEVLALRGARNTIRRLRPFVIVEEFGHGRVFGFPPHAAAHWLEDRGYRKVWEAGPNLGFEAT